MARNTKIRALELKTNPFVLESKRCNKDNWFVNIDGKDYLIRRPKGVTWRSFEFSRSQFILCLREPSNEHSDKITRLDKVEYLKMIPLKTKKELIAELHEDCLQLVEDLK